MSSFIGKDILVERVMNSLEAQGSRMSDEKVRSVISATLEEISKALNNGEEVRLMGFGTFYGRDRKARESRSIHDGSIFSVPDRKSVGFRASKILKSTLNA